jgi:hypothetical protein
MTCGIGGLEPTRTHLPSSGIFQVGTVTITSPGCQAQARCRAGRSSGCIAQEKYVPSMYRLVVGAEQESATPSDDRELRSIKNGGGGGNRTRVREQVLRDHYVRSQSMLRLSRPHQLRLTGSGLDQF